MTEDEQPTETAAEELAEQLLSSDDVTPFVAWELQNKTIHTIGTLYAKLYESGISPESSLLRSLETVLIDVAEDCRPRNAGIKASFDALAVEDTAENADDRKEA
jgi:hypothetical protein